MRRPPIPALIVYRLRPLPEEPVADRIVFARRSIERKAEDHDAAEFDAMARILEAGVQVVTASQRFLTPHGLARCVVFLASIEILEPSAGTDLAQIEACLGRKNV